MAEPIPVFSFEVVVARDDVDLFQHANNICYLRWMQDAAMAHSAANDWPT